MADLDWARQSELTHLLQACRGRMASPVPGTRGGGMRQEDAAGLANLSLRRYAAFERGQITPAAAVVDRVATALQMNTAERSALHVLATGQDPPRPVSQPGDTPPPEPSQALRDLVTQLDPYPAALTDEMWTLRFRNPAMDAWAGGWYDSAPPDEQNMLLYLFSGHAEDLFPDIRALRRHLMAALRYQYARNLAAPGFAELVARLGATGPEAAGLWERHEVAIQPHEYPTRIRHPDHGIIPVQMVFMPFSPRLWQYTLVLPPGIKPPHPAPEPVSADSIKHPLPAPAAAPDKPRLYP
jgi:transcriptional regulator with XRE-family HTH domain